MFYLWHSLALTIRTATCTMENICVPCSMQRTISKNIILEFYFLLIFGEKITVTANYNEVQV